MPNAFTENGVAMLSSVLNSERAIQVNISMTEDIHFVARNAVYAQGTENKFEDMEKKYDSQFKLVFDAIRQLMAPPVKGKKEIGFKVWKE